MRNLTTGHTGPLFAVVAERGVQKSDARWPQKDSDMVDTDFNSELDPRWNRFLKGEGTLEHTGRSLRFVNTGTDRKHYTNAQIDDYQGLPRGELCWRPPLTMTVRARFSHPADDLRGTAGFGFWNDPFLMTGWRMPTLPRAIWFFFGSPPSYMKLDMHAPGHGWKAATIDALRWPFFLLLPSAPLAIPLMNIRPLYRALWPIAQRAIKVSEALLDVDMTLWHTYVLAWGEQRAHFRVDGRLFLDCDTPPRGPLGFVMWFDNQYAIVTPWGRVGYGLLDAPGRQWMEVDQLTFAPEL
jgi:hypothetical protein